MIIHLEDVLMPLPPRHLWCYRKLWGGAHHPPRPTREGSRVTKSRVFGKLLRVGRATALALGVGVMLALVLGATTLAVAAVPGDPFRLGQVNSINKLSTRKTRPSRKTRRSLGKWFI